MTEILEQQRVDIDTRDDIRVTVKRYRGTVYLDIRVWWNDRPTKKGINVELADVVHLQRAVASVLNKYQVDEVVDWVEMDPDREQMMTSDGELYALSLIP